MFFLLMKVCGLLFGGLGGRLLIEADKIICGAVFVFYMYTFYHFCYIISYAGCLRDTLYFGVVF